MVVTFALVYECTSVGVIEMHMNGTTPRIIPCTCYLVKIKFLSYVSTVALYGRCWWPGQVIDFDGLPAHGCCHVVPAPCGSCWWPDLADDCLRKSGPETHRQGSTCLPPDPAAPRTPPAECNTFFTFTTSLHRLLLSHLCRLNLSHIIERPFVALATKLPGLPNLLRDIRHQTWPENVELWKLASALGKTADFIFIFRLSISAWFGNAEEAPPSLFQHIQHPSFIALLLSPNLPCAVH